MIAESEEVRVEDLIDEIAMGPFGSNIKTDCFVNSGIPVFNGSNLTGFETNDAALRYVTPEKANSLGNALASRGDIVITHRGTLGQVAMVPYDSKYPRYVISQSQFRIRCNDKVLPKFFVYYFHTREGQWRLLSNKTQTGVPALGRPTSTFRKLSMPLPTFENQAKIVQVIDAIQEKIKNNAKLNGYLEEWGQSFLENYQESCATTIPLRNVMDFGNGYAFKSETYIQSGLYKILTIKNVQDGSVDCSTSNRIDELPPKMKSFCKLQPGNVVLSLTGNVGRVGIVSEENCLLNQRVAVLQPYNYALLPGLYFHFRQKAFQNEMIGIAKGTAQANLSPVETLKLEMPYNESFLDICQKLKPAFDLILANTIESKRLTVLRDALLPKLMSGEIDVSKVDLTQPNSHLA